jgi:YVTN family beta-propeller protein
VSTALAVPGRSTTIAALDAEHLIVVNRDVDTVSILQVLQRDQEGNGYKDVGIKLAEIAVGHEPHCVAVHPKWREAYVTNAVSGTVSVVAFDDDVVQVVDEIPVGTEPRGCAITPNGTQLYVANHTAGTVSVIDLAQRKVIETVVLPLEPLSGNPAVNPQAIAITDDDDDDDTDEQVFVTQFFAELIPDGPGEGFDDGKRGIVHAFSTANPTHVVRIPLSPIDSGFTSNRSVVCQQFNPAAPNNTFCPDPTITDANDPVIAADPQAVYPNQLYAALIRDQRLFVVNIGAQPEPVIRFNANVQALVHVVDTDGRVELTDQHVNLNREIAQEPFPDPDDLENTKLRHLFGNDIVALDANQKGDKFLIISRGANYALLAHAKGDKPLTIGNPKHVVRFQTGNLPNGVVISHDGKRAYVNNKANCSVTAIDLENHTVIERDISSCEPPAPGTPGHILVMGELAFFTALGIPDNRFFDQPIRDIIPIDFRGKASDNAWSDCGSCHPDGLTDNVTWSFETGPRQTLPLDAFFADDNHADQRVSNWSAVRSSNADFNNNSRGIQGGCGFASADLAGEDPPDPCTPDNALTPANPDIYNHGVSIGASDALDVQTYWIQEAVRTLLQPPLKDTDAIESGRELFAENCASCHGGQKWTKSQVIYLDNPAFDANPIPAPGGVPGVPRDPGVIAAAGGQIQSYTDVNPATGVSLFLDFLDDVGTFNAGDAIEIRGNNGNAPLGVLGFNTPSLLGVAYTAPYLHQGRAQNLSELFAQHKLVGDDTIADVLDNGQEKALMAFLKTIDVRTTTFRSATDDFISAVGR